MKWLGETRPYIGLLILDVIDRFMIGRQLHIYNVHAEGIKMVIRVWALERKLMLLKGQPGL